MTPAPAAPAPRALRRARALGRTRRAAALASEIATGAQPPPRAANGEHWTPPTVVLARGLPLELTCCTARGTPPRRAPLAAPCALRTRPPASSRQRAGALRPRARRRALGALSAATLHWTAAAAGARARARAARGCRSRCPGAVFAALEWKRSAADCLHTHPAAIAACPPVLVAPPREGARRFGRRTRPAFLRPAPAVLAAAGGPAAPAPGRARPRPRGLGSGARPAAPKGRRRRRARRPPAM